MISLRVFFVAQLKFYKVQCSDEEFDFAINDERISRNLCMYFGFMLSDSDFDRVNHLPEVDKQALINHIRDLHLLDPEQPLPREVTAHKERKTVAMNFALYVKDFFPGFQALQQKGTLKRTSCDLYKDFMALA
jgi:hypothetical protein